MDGLFNMLGGNATGLQELMTPQMQQALRNQSMMAMAASLLKASGPSPQRQSLGQILGGAFEAGQGAMQQGQMNAVQQMLLGQKLQEAKSESEAKKRWLEITGGGAPTTAADALAMPGRMGPTAERAAQIGTVQPHPLMAGLTPTQQAIARTFTNPTEGLKFISEIEARNAAQSEVTGQPFSVTDAQGRPVLVQQTKGGKITTVEGFGPKREVVLQNLGGRTVAIDKNQLTGGESFAQTMTPGESANLGVRLQETELVETPEGYVRVPKFGGGAAQPVVGATGQPVRGRAGTEKPTEGQLTASGFATRMEAAEQIFSSIPAGDVPRVGMSTSGGMTSGILNFMRSPEGQKAKQAADDWIRAKLRKESGAVIGAEEMEAEYRTYFPMPGDSDLVVRQKADARARATEAMRRNAGPAYQPMQPQEQQPSRPAAPQGMRGELVYDPQRRVYVYR